MKKHIKKTDAAVFAAAIPEETMLDIASVVKEAAWAERHKNDLPATEEAATYEQMHTTPLVMWVENGHMFAARHITTCTDFNTYARTLCWRDDKPCSMRQIKRSLRRIRAAHAARQAAEDLERALATPDVPFFWDEVSDPEDPDVLPWPFDEPMLDDIDPWPALREELQARWEREDAPDMPREGGEA